LRSLGASEVPAPGVSRCITAQSGEPGDSELDDAGEEEDHHHVMITPMIPMPPLLVVIPISHSGEATPLSRGVGMGSEPMRVMPPRDTVTASVSRAVVGAS